MTRTYTRSRSSTWTAARVRHVMAKILDDILNLTSRGLLSREEAQSWHADLSYLLNEQATERFEFQFRRSNGTSGIRYEIDDTGLIVEDRDSGGLDLAWLPIGTRVSLVVELRDDLRNRQAILDELARRGWGFNANLLQGTPRRDGGYSKDGYGATRWLLGDME